LATYLLIGLGVAVVLEGLAYALFPGMMKRFLTQMMETPVEQLRLAGVFLLAVGVALVWFFLPSG
jgi:uncharacterized protein YjeT (DUF2065 family)